MRCAEDKSNRPLGEMLMSGRSPSEGSRDRSFCHLSNSWTDLNSHFRAQKDVEIKADVSETPNSASAPAHFLVVSNIPLIAIGMEVPGILTENTCARSSLEREAPNH